MCLKICYTSFLLFKGNYRTNNLSTNNCRIENIRTSKLYNPILLNGGRCIIMVEGYYEWQTTVKNKVKQPFYMYAPQEEYIKVRYLKLPSKIPLLLILVLPRF